MACSSITSRMEQESARLFRRSALRLIRARRCTSWGGAKQLVEIGKALARRSHILVLDEPTAALSDRECVVLLDLLRELRARHGLCLHLAQAG